MSQSVHTYQWNEYTGVFTGAEGCALIVLQNSVWRITCKNRILTRSHIFSLEVSLSLLLPPAVQLNSYSGSYWKAQTSLRHKMPKNEVLRLQYKAVSLRCLPVHQLL